MIIAEQVVLLYARSGAGKTSMLKAKVMPALEGKQRRGEPLLRVFAPVRLGGNLPADVQLSDEEDNIFVYNTLLALEKQRVGEIADPGALRGTSLGGYLEAHHEGLKQRPPVLVFDQFEELFTCHQDRWPDVEGFFKELSRTQVAIPGLSVLLSMREDFLARLEPYEKLFSGRLGARFRLTRLDRDAAIKAVRGPAGKRGCPFEEGDPAAEDPRGAAEKLVDNLLAVKGQGQQGAGGFVGKHVEPVQLQVVCHRLWKELPIQDDYEIQWEEVEEFGDPDEALTRFYREALMKAAVAANIVERRVREWFAEKLITPAGTRGTALWDEEKGEAAGLPGAAVEELAAQHLIRSESRAGGTWYELSHDRLVDPVMADNAAYRDELQPWQLQAEAWDRSGRMKGMLLRGTELDAALVWARSSSNRPKTLMRDHEFLASSGEEARARREMRAQDKELAEHRSRVNKRLRGGLLTAMVLLILAIVAWCQASKSYESASADKKWTKEHRQDAKSLGKTLKEARELTAKARREANEFRASVRKKLDQYSEMAAINAARALPRDPLVALLVMRELGAAPTSPGTWRAAAALAKTPLPMTRIKEPLGQTGQVRPARGGDRMVTLSGPGRDTVRVWDLLGGKVLREEKAGGPVAYVSISRDGGRVAYVTEAKKVYVCPVQGGQACSSVVAHKGEITGLSLDNSGQHLLTTSLDGKVKLWRVKDGIQVVAERQHEGPVVSALLAPGAAGLLTVTTGGVPLTTHFWQVRDGKELVPRQRMDGARPGSFSNDSALFTTHAGKTALVWDAGTGKLRASLGRHDKEVLGSWLFPDGGQVLTLARDGKVRRFSLAGGKASELSPPPVNRRVRSAGVGPGGRLIATCSSGEGVAVWRIRDDGKIDSVREIPMPEPAQEVWFSGDGKRLFIVGADLSLQTWEIAPAAPRKTVGAAGLSEVAFSPNASLLATVSAKGLELRERETGKELHLQQPGGGTYSRPRFSPDGARLLVIRKGAAKAEEVLTWKVATGIPGDTDTLKGMNIAAASFGLGKGPVAAVTVGRNTLELRDLDHKSRLATAKLLDASLLDVRFHPVVARMITLSRQGGARIWECGRQCGILSTLRSHRPCHLATFSPRQNEVLASCSENSVEIRDAQKGGLKAALPVRVIPGATEVLFAPEEGRFALVSVRDRVTVLAMPVDTNAGWRVAKIFDHRNAVPGVGLDSKGEVAYRVDAHGKLIEIPLTWEAIRLKLAGRTRACLTPGERERYLLEAPRAAEKKFRACMKTLR